MALVYIALYVFHAAHDDFLDPSDRCPCTSKQKIAAWDIVSKFMAEFEERPIWRSVIPCGNSALRVFAGSHGR